EAYPSVAASISRLQKAMARQVILCERGFIEHLARNWNFILDAEEIFKKPENRLGVNRLRMKLHALDPQLSMAKAHNRAVVRFGGYFKLARQRFSLDDQRMIARGLKFLRQAAKNGPPVVLDPARLAVHQFTCADHTPPKRRPDCLMSQAHAKNRDFTRKTLD